ncbi:hypothetical protein AMTRI_Chr13g85890 [Amborella trichopoda]
MDDPPTHSLFFSQYSYAEYRMISSIWDDKEDGNEVLQLWEDDWDDDDVNDDFSIQLKRELESNSEKN